MGVLAVGLVAAFAAAAAPPALALDGTPECPAPREAAPTAGPPFGAERAEAASLAHVAATRARPRFPSWARTPAGPGALADDWSRIRVPDVPLGTNVRPLAATTPRPDIWGPAQERWLGAGGCHCPDSLVRADVWVATADTPDPATAGGPLFYEIAVGNFGPDTAAGLTLVDTLAPETTFVSSSPGSPTCGHAGGVVTCDLDPIPGGSTSFVDIQVAVAPGFTGTLANTALVSAVTFDPVSSNDAVVEHTTVEPPSPGAVPDGAAGVPLRLAKTPGSPSLELTWGASCEAAAGDYSVHEGELGAFYTHTALVCSTSGALSATVTPSLGDRYYLVVPLTDDAEGSYGRDSTGAERPASTGACRVTQVAGACP